VITLVLSSLLVVLGGVIVVRTLAEGVGGGFGLLAGALFIAAGCGRLYLQRWRPFR
jgi:hypothetical protein